MRELKIAATVVFVLVFGIMLVLVVTSYVPK